MTSGSFLTRITRRHTRIVEDTSPQAPSQSGDHAQDAKDGDPEHPKLKACLTTLDLVSLGVGSCLGTGMYLTTGLVAGTMSGPAGVLSFLVAGFGSVLSGLCYAELAGLCPKTSGSAYMYTYVTLGELAAFVIGWGLIVEYVIGTAAGAVALSETIDSLSNKSITAVLDVAAHSIGIPKLDVVAAGICLLLTMVLSSGVEMSARVNNGFNLTNLVVLLFFVSASLGLGSVKNWVSVGFMPFHVKGIIRAIPTCYYAFIGFDTVATTGEEAQDPRRSIPISIIASVLINCLAYVVVTACLTYDLPYNALHHDTAMMDIFSQMKFNVGKYIVAVGAVSGLFAATFGSMFPLPRVLSAMASDGLIFSHLAKICPKRRTPLRATLLSGVVAMVMATFVNLEILIELVLIGTLLSYVLVTVGVLLMRYAPQPHRTQNTELKISNTSSSVDTPKTPERPVSALPPDCAQTRSDVQACCKKSQTLKGNIKLDSSTTSQATTPLCDSPFSRLIQKVSLKKQTGYRRLNSSSDDDTVDVDANDVRCSSETDFSSCHNSDDTSSVRHLCRRTSANSEEGTPCTHSSSKVQSHKPEQARWFYTVIRMTDYFSTSLRIMVLLTCVYVVELALSLLTSVFWTHIADGNTGALISLGVLSALLIVLVGVICLLPQTAHGNSFRTPLVPALPVLVALFNIYFMTSLSGTTWILFASWMALGMFMYFLYGIRHSTGETHPPFPMVAKTQSEEMVTSDR